MVTTTLYEVFAREEQPVADLRAIIQARMTAIGMSAGQLAAVVSPRWITKRSPNGLDTRTAEQTLVHWLAGRKDQIPLPAIEAALDALRLRVIPY